MPEVTLKKTDDEPEDVKMKRLLMIAMESAEKYGASVGFNLKDIFPSEVVHWWHDHKATLVMVRSAQARDKVLREENAKVDEKVRNAIRKVLTQGEYASWKLRQG